MTASKPVTVDDDDDDLPLKPPVLLKREKPQPVAVAPAKAPTAPIVPADDVDLIDLSYKDDEPAAAAVDAAFIDDSEPMPSEHAVVPPPDERAVAVAATEAAAAGCFLLKSGPCQ